MRTHNDTVELANSLKKHSQTQAESTSTPDASSSAEDRTTPGELPVSVKVPVESEAQSGQSPADEDSTVVIKEEVELNEGLNIGSTEDKINEKEFERQSLEDHPFQPFETEEIQIKEEHDFEAGNGYTRLFITSLGRQGEGQSSQTLSFFLEF